MTSQTMMRERASVPLEVKATGGVDGETGTFEGYGAIFGNLDRDGDVVARGAFSESLKGRMPALLWQHNAKEPIGRFDVVREDEKGLYVKGRLSMEGRGREAYELLKMGALDGLSIGFVTKEASRDPVSGTRTIMRAELMEISLVTFPANELARVMAVKSHKAGLGQGVPDSPRDFERMLRAHGFSRARAKAITAKGFGGEDSRSGDDAIVGMIKSLNVSKVRLSALPCGPNCVECEPCRKTHKAAFGATCETLRNDIKDGNRSRWHAWGVLDRKINVLRIKTQRFARDRELGLVLDAAFAGVDVIGAIVTPSPMSAAQAALSVVQLIDSIKNFNGNYASDLRRALLADIIAVEGAKERALHLDRIFWKQVAAFKQGNCGSLSSSDFNRS